MDSLTLPRTDARPDGRESSPRAPLFLSTPAAASGSRFTGRRVHFIGIGGCGMSGLAHMLIDAGAIVTGSEPNANPQTAALARRGARISAEQKGDLLEGLKPGVDWVVRTAAIPDANAEFLAARALGVEPMKYAELLGRVMQERFGVAVAGTHGKSTTTAMIGFALSECGLAPSFVVGGTVPQLGGGSRSGAGDAFVVEACEFDRSFLNLFPRLALISNIEEDHLDCYKDIGQIVAAFGAFARRVPADGLVIANGQDPNVARALAGVGCRVQTVGLGSGFDWSAQPRGAEGGGYAGDVTRDGRAVGAFRLSVAGEHNLFNATMALAACVACGAEPGAAIEALNRFTGVDRRMSEVGRCNGATLVDDYGHHPTEIRATLKAVRGKYAPRRLLCVFQPHQHSRTRFLLDDFAASFAGATEVIVPDIYFVRDSEAEKQSVSSADLVQRIVGNGQRARHLGEFPAIVDYLRGQAREGDVILTMGAGNVWEICRDLTC